MLLNARLNIGFIGRFERFEEDLSIVKDRVIGNKDESVARVAPHATNAESFANEMLTPLASELIQDIYRKDFAQFGYSTKLTSI